MYTRRRARKDAMFSSTDEENLETLDVEYKRKDQTMNGDSCTPTEHGHSSELNTLEVFEAHVTDESTTDDESKERVATPPTIRHNRIPSRNPSNRNSPVHRKGLRRNVIGSPVMHQMTN